MNAKELTQAINFLRPGAEFSFTEGDYSTIKWDVLEGDAPTMDELEAAAKQIKKQEEAKRKIALDKLAALGLTPDDLKAINLG